MEQRELVDVALGWVRSNTRNPDVVADDVGPDTDLLGTAVLDSIGLVQLLVHVQDRLGRDIELEDADPEDFLSVASICHFAVRQSGSEAGA